MSINFRIGLVKGPKGDDGNLEEIVNYLFPIGSLYEQKPGAPGLEERGLPGTYAVWSHRAVRYELVPVESYPSSVSNYTNGQAVNVGDHRIYQLTGDDKQIWRCKTAHTCGVQIDPLHWELVSGITRVDRRIIHNNIWTDNDKDIGDTVTYNGTAYRVTGILVLGGKFLSVEGGNRPSSNDGTEVDKQRNISGNVGFNDNGIFTRAEGVFVGNPITGNGTSFPNDPRAPSFFRYATFDSSRVVSTAAENSPRTSAIRYWRRVS